MTKALPNSVRDAAARQAHAPAERGLDWRKRMSDHIAYGLLVYTGLQIFVTMGALKTGGESILPYFALVILVAAVIPVCRLFERRWDGLSDEQAANPELADLYKRDRNLVWAAAIGLPFVFTGLFKLALLII
ncbi:MAG TPA: hypothetical protein VF418_08165 [Sphingomonadaceae bacterium]